MIRILSCNLVIGCAAVLTACGGGGSNTGVPANGATPIAAGTIYVMPADTTVEVPSGTTISAPNGTLVTINGDDNTIRTQVGATVSVPTTATGTPNNAVTTGLAGIANITTSTITAAVLAGSATTSGNPVDGTGSAAIFWGGGHMATQSNGNLIVSDRGTLRLVTPTGVVTTLTSAYPYDWEGIAVDASGNVYGSGNQVVGSQTFGASVAEWTNTGSAGRSVCELGNRLGLDGWGVIGS